MQETRKRLASAPPNPEAMRRRLDAALEKDMFGYPLSERELVMVQWVRNGGGCAACGPTGTPGLR
jgi:hypothetical protein